MITSAFIKTVTAMFCLVAAVASVGADCLRNAVPGEGVIENDSINSTPVCKSVLRALNAQFQHCDVPLLGNSFKPRGDRDLTLPKWEVIPLFDRRGREIPAAFAQLERQVRGRVRVTLSWEKKEREDREVARILNNVRVSQRTKHPLQFARTTILVDDIRRPEVVYQLVRKKWDVLRRDLSSFASFPVGDHDLFLERDASWPAEGSNLTQGPTNGITSGGYDFFLFQRVPYQIALTHLASVHAVYVYKPVYAQPYRDDLGFDKIMLSRLVCLFISERGAEATMRIKD